MEEVFADFLSDDQMNNMKLLDQIMQKSVSNGVQIGVPWNKEVYDYLFESGENIDLSNILNMNVIVAEVQQDIF